MVSKFSPERTYNYSTDPLTILELQNPSNGVCEQHRILQFPDREALKL